MNNVNEVIKHMTLKGYDVFLNDSKNYNLNIVGIRNQNLTTDIFNDWMIVFWKYNNRLNQRWYKITTDPGDYTLKNPYSQDGTAILVPDQYRGVYKIDKHQGKYEALCQRGGMVKVFRDNNKDESLDMDINRIQEGWFGINIHGASQKTDVTKNVGAWSAGCQVFQDWRDFEEFMSICKRASEIWGNSFTYTLLEE